MFALFSCICYTVFILLAFVGGGGGRFSIYFTFFFLALYLCCWFLEFVHAFLLFVIICYCVFCACILWKHKKATRNYVRIYSLIIMLTSVQKKINLMPHLICAIGETHTHTPHRQQRRRHYFTNSWWSKWKLKLIEIDVLNACLTLSSLLPLCVRAFLHPCSITPNHYSFVLTQENRAKEKEKKNTVNISWSIVAASFVFFFIVSSFVVLFFLHLPSQILRCSLNVRTSTRWLCLK